MAAGGRIVQVSLYFLSFLSLENARIVVVVMDDISSPKVQNYLNLTMEIDIKYKVFYKSHSSGWTTQPAY